MKRCVPASRGCAGSACRPTEGLKREHLARQRRRRGRIRDRYRITSSLPAAWERPVTRSAQTGYARSVPPERRRALRRLWRRASLGSRPRRCHLDAIGRIPAQFSTGHPLPLERRELVPYQEVVRSNPREATDAVPADGAGPRVCRGYNCTDYFSGLAPSNVMIARAQMMSPPRWRNALMLAALATAALVLMRLLAVAILAGSRGWLNLIVLILAWDAIKFALASLLLGCRCLYGAK